MSKHNPAPFGVAPRLAALNATGTCAVGAAAEHLVIADLLRRGIEPFRACSPGAPCDILLLTPDRVLLRVEVKSSWRALTKGKADRSRFDVAAVVTDSGITYWAIRRVARQHRLVPFDFAPALRLVV